jgi:chemotaxis protein methyltransferase WspC
MPLSQIIALLRENVGLDVASVGVSLIERAVARRINANELSDISQYADHLQRSGTELQRLVETVVIAETFFFRYPESFAALRQIVEERFLFGTQKMRVLSVPCSTGEEPYTIAMTLCDAGLSLDRFQIDAIDISADVLDTALLGIFGSNSFRGGEFRFRKQYFQKTDGGYRLCDQLRQCVKFQQGNILEEPFRVGSEPYDFIFCRNLLIYFYSEAQGKVLKRLRQLLTADGLLFVGSAETGQLTQNGFSSVKLPMAFAFRKSESLAYHTPSTLKPPKVSLPPGVGKNASDRPPNLAIPKRVVPEAAKQHEKTSLPDLTFAEQLADQGQLKKAAAICEISLREQGPSARAFHLLGLIHDCVGDQLLAIEYYRKALYLEPDHYDALIHLALLKDKGGDGAGAKALKNRALRVLERMK